MKLSDLLIARTGFVPPKNTSTGKALQRAGVPDSPELRRIVSLPRRNPEGELANTQLPAVPLRLDRCPGCTLCRGAGTAKLWPIQMWALREIKKMNGGLLPIGVGHGKTLISILAATVLQAKKTIILVPAALREQLLLVDIPAAKRHFFTEIGGLHIVSYESLSSTKSADVLDHAQPDLIVADEAHRLRHRSAARTKRFLRYFKDHPECRLVAMSGTITTRSLRDYAHLAELALHKSSPLPHGYRELQDWADAIDVPQAGVDPMPPGMLEKLLCAPSEHVRDGFRRRLVETPGVVSTSAGALGTSLTIRSRELSVPQDLEQLISLVGKFWQTPEGEVIEEGMEMARIMRQLALGFHYRWDWPGGVIDQDWLEARALWRTVVRDVLKHRARAGLDSPLLVAQAAQRDELKPHEFEAWTGWDAVRSRPAPPTVPVWHSDYAVHDALTWATLACPETRGIIWFEHAAFGEALAAKGVVPIFRGGDDAELAVAAADPTIPVVACSIKAHGTGKNLQAFSRCLVTSPPANGAAWEQLLGRTHRPGQEADEVVVDAYLTGPGQDGAFKAALDDARYVEQTQGGRQKLCYAKIMLDSLAEGGEG